jgi:RluA family pseudouridine synthase
LSEPAPPPALPAEIVHRDDDVVAVNKPPGLPVIPARGEGEDACLWRRLEAALGERLWVIHRIDRDTSGLVVFARNAEAHRALSMAFERREVRKRYLAFAAGALPASGRIDVALHAARKGKARPALPGEAEAKPAVTEYRVVRSWRCGGQTVSLVEARPLTGRHHQIRVHLRSLEAPIVGDPLYGKRTRTGALAGAPCARLALHASGLDAPAVRAGAQGGAGGGARIVLEAPLAADLVALAAWLDAHCEGSPGGG